MPTTQRTQLNELMIVGPISVGSACSLHLYAIMGKAGIGLVLNATTEPLYGRARRGWIQ